MSIYHKDKCTKEEAQTFLADVKQFCADNNIRVNKFLALTSYGGEIRLYNGEKETRRSKKRVMQHDEVGYFLSKTNIIKAEYTQVFRSEWYNKEFQEEEKEAIKSFFKTER
jgi:hypothetical protein